MSKTILVTGGAGYIGSHTALYLLENGFDVIVFDSLEKGHKETLDKTESITGKELDFIKADLRDKKEISEKLKNKSFDGVIHFAAYPDISLSVSDPSRYFWNNVVGSANLIEVLREQGRNNLVFSSTSEVYGNAPSQPITEDMPRIPTNMYGESKRMVEIVLETYSQAYEFKSVILRYFNAAGADLEGRIGEWHEPELHLIPNAIKGVLGIHDFELTSAKVDTKDGTPVRDYVHVMDLASAHLKSLQYLWDGGQSEAFNVGTGSGNSVLEVIEEIEKITGKELPKKQGEPRPGEPAIKYADTHKIEEKLGWKAEYGMKEIIESAWKWHSGQKN